MYGADSATQREAMNQAGQDRRAASRSQPNWNQVTDENGNVRFIAPGENPQDAGVRVPLPRQPEQKADLQPAIDYLKSLTDVNGNPLPGREEEVEQLRAAIYAELMGSRPGQPPVPQTQQPNNAGPGSLPGLFNLFGFGNKTEIPGMIAPLSPEMEAMVQQAMRDSKQPREVILKRLAQTGLLK
jgi:hypothetical protein